jgi:hypothetical protein
MTSVNENHELIKQACDKVMKDADEYGYDCDLNAFHLQLMLDVLSTRVCRLMKLSVK